MLSTAVGMVDSGAHASEKTPENSIITKAIEFVEDGNHAKQMLANSLGVAANVLSRQDPAESLLHNTTELAQQNLNNQQLAPSSRHQPIMLLFLPIMLCCMQYS